MLLRGLILPLVRSLPLLLLFRCLLFRYLVRLLLLLVLLLCLRLRFLLFLLILLRFLHLIFYRFSCVSLMIFPCTSSPFTILLLALDGIYGASCPCVDSTTLHHTHIQPSCLRYSLHHLSSYPRSFQTVNQVDCPLPGHCGFILLLPPVELFVVRA